MRLFHAVHSLVSPQVLSRLKALAAGGADERSRVRVDGLVRLQVHFCFERLVTVLALVRCVFLLLVPLQVALKRRRSSKFPRTLVAGENPLFFVRVAVFQQVKLPAEALVAHFTFKELFGLFGFCSSCCFLAVKLDLGFCWVLLLCDIWIHKSRANKRHNGEHISHKN